MLKSIGMKMIERIINYNENTMNEKRKVKPQLKIREKRTEEKPYVEERDWGDSISSIWREPFWDGI